MLDIAEKENAQKVYVCISKNLKDAAQLMKTLSFVGFEVLKEARPHSLLKTQTHIVMQTNLMEEEDEI